MCTITRGRRGSVATAAFFPLALASAVLVLLTLVPVVAIAQASPAPVAVLVYADDIWEVEILDFTGVPLDYVDFGSEVLIGFGVRTGATTAELRLEPNGSLLRIAEGSFVKIEELQGLSNTRVNSAALIAGRVRFVAASVSGQNYRITTPSAVIGVRGTDFAVAVDEDRGATVAVERGQVEVFDPFSRRNERIGPGQAFSVRDQVIARVAEEREAVQRLVRQAEFAGADTAAVPTAAPGEYQSTFDYVRDIEAEEFRAFFADEDYFEDYQEYIDRYRDYYRSEMVDFQAVLDREAAALRDRREAAERASGEESESFREWLEEN